MIPSEALSAIAQNVERTKPLAIWAMRDPDEKQLEPAQSFSKQPEAFGDVAAAHAALRPRECNAWGQKAWEQKAWEQWERHGGTEHHDNEKLFTLIVV